MHMREVKIVRQFFLVKFVNKKGYKNDISKYLFTYLISANNNMSSPLIVQFLSDNARLPKKGSEGAAGYDLCSAYDMVIGPHDKGIVKTDIAIKVPVGTYGRVAPRSGLAAKHFIDVGAGVIDSDYRGNIGVVLFNHSNEVFEIRKGDRIAQLIIEVIKTPDVKLVDKIEETMRGDGGFGSTGIS